MKKLLLVFILFAFKVSAQDSKLETTTQFLVPVYAPYNMRSILPEGAVTAELKHWDHLRPNRVIALVLQDSVKINVNIQARDLEYTAAIIPYIEDFEGVYDAVKAKFRVPVPPTGATNVAIDSIPVIVWFRVMQYLQRDHIAIGGNVFSRMDAILRAKNNTWLNARLDEALADATVHYNNLRALGRKRLTKK